MSCNLAITHRLSVVSCVSAQLSWDGRFLYTLHTKTGFQGDESTIKVGQASAG
jgi:hypothetical protein